MRYLDSDCEMGKSNDRVSQFSAEISSIEFSLVPSSAAMSFLRVHIYIYACFPVHVHGEVVGRTVMSVGVSVGSVGWSVNVFTLSNIIILNGN